MDRPVLYLPYECRGTVEHERSAKFEDVVLSLTLRCAVYGDLANALLVTLGNEEHIIYRLARVSSSLFPNESKVSPGPIRTPRPPPEELGRLALGLDTPLWEESASIIGSLWTGRALKIRGVDFFSVNILLYLGNRSAVENIQEVCEGNGCVNVVSRFQGGRRAVNRRGPWEGGHHNHRMNFMRPRAERKGVPGRK